MEEELDDTKEAIASVGIVEEVAVHLKIELTSIMSPDTLKTKSGAHSKKNWKNNNEGKCAHQVPCKQEETDHKLHQH